MAEQKRIKEWQIIVISFIVSFLFLMICSNNSFLYTFNDNQDINWYITMGNGLLEGKVPYRDLYEQKGPIVYFVFSLFCLFKNAYHACFVAEVICSTIFLYFSYKIIKYIVGNKNSIYSIILTAFTTFTSVYFVVGGGAVEEYCLPIFAYMLLCFFEFIKEEKIFSSLRSLIWGFLIGILFFVKFTLLLFPFIVFTFFAVFFIKEKKYKQLFKMIGMLSLGIIIVASPIIIYFIKNRALIDFLTAYLYNNIFLYSGENNIFYNIGAVCGLGALAFAFMVLGVVYYEITNKDSKYKKCYLILFVSYAILLILSGNFAYYFLPLTVFVPVGVCAFLKFVFERFSNKINKYTISTSLILLFVFCFLLGNGTIELNDKKNDYIQFNIAQDIRSINNENPTLFCYKLWDYGFYNALGIVPNIKYFANNVFEEDAFPEMYNSFNDYIENKETEFLLVETKVYNEEKEFIDNYYQYHKTYSYKYYKDNYRSFKMEVILLIKK